MSAPNKRALRLKIYVAELDALDDIIIIPFVSDLKAIVELKLVKCIPVNVHTELIANPPADIHLDVLVKDWGRLCLTENRGGSEALGIPPPTSLDVYLAVDVDRHLWLAKDAEDGTLRQRNGNVRRLIDEDAKFCCRHRLLHLVRKQR